MSLVENLAPSHIYIYIHKYLFLPYIHIYIYIYIYIYIQITDEGVSLVENLELDREPMCAMEAIYFVSPTYESMKRICAGIHIYTHTHAHGIVYTYTRIYTNPCALWRLFMWVSHLRVDEANLRWYT